MHTQLDQGSYLLHLPPSKLKIITLHYIHYISSLQHQKLSNIIKIHLNSIHKRSSSKMCSTRKCVLAVATCKNSLKNECMTMSFQNSENTHFFCHLKSGFFFFFFLILSSYSFPNPNPNPFLLLGFSFSNICFQVSILKYTSSKYKYLKCEVIIKLKRFCFAF